jgi:solute carrier family 25 oxoglutarate transporter 11
MSTDKNLPEGQRRGYKNAFNAIFRIAKEESVLALWKVIF